MKCPVDGSDLIMTERQGVEIDYCPKCRGVWLDRGELDKIIERSAQQDVRPAAPPPAPNYQPARQPHPSQQGSYRYDDDDDDRYRYGSQGYGQPPQKKKRSLLDDIFDF